MKKNNLRLLIVAIVAMFMVGSTGIVDAKVKKGKTKTTAKKTGKKASQSNNLTFTVNGVKFEMVPVDGGSFTMTNRVDYDKYEKVNVTLEPYSIGQTEVTQALWKAVMEKNPSQASMDEEDKCPVDNVRYKDCLLFIEKLNELTGKNFRIPTTAEWQFAARGGNKSKGYKYSGGNDINKVAWYLENSDGRTQEVATKAANELGIYDMSGNVSEWCTEYNEYGTLSAKDNTSLGLARRSATFCNGNWRSAPEECEIKFMWQEDAEGSCSIGLRLAL